MEHEDNYLQNSQNLMENLQNATGGVSGGGIDLGGLVECGEGIVAGMGSNIVGGKFEDDDDEEWKYIKEVQQSEKQQQQQQQQQTMKHVVDFGGHCGDVNDDVKAIAAEAGFDNGVSSNSNGDDLFIAKHDDFDFGNGDVNAMIGSGNLLAYEEDVEIIKHDTDFSTTSNTMSTPGEEDIASTDPLKVEMKIDSADVAEENVQQQQFLHTESLQTEEEEPSSLGTNTTNGTSSLSENAQQQQEEQQLQRELQQQFDEFALEDKENTDPKLDTVERPMSFEHELHSMLNPDAKEFVPTFGSNPSSPIAATSDAPTFGIADVVSVGEPAAQQEPHPTAVPRHLLDVAADDDFVAESPRKGRCANMDGIAVPAENEFEHEAAKRPHELEQEDDLIAEGTLATQQLESLEQLENGSSNDLLQSPAATEECLDQQNKSPTGFIDHGPETSVDMDVDIDMLQQPADVMKQSVYVERDASEPIEDLLNTVQPLPTDSDSLNNSFIEISHPEEEEATTGTVGDKELLHVEEKEHVSHSPSTEEMQMNLKNDFYSSSSKDIPQIPIDMDNAANMGESFYMEQTSADYQEQQQHHEQQHHEHEPELEPEHDQEQLVQEHEQLENAQEPLDTVHNTSITTAAIDESLLADTSMPLDNSHASEVSFEAIRAHDEQPIDTATAEQLLVTTDNFMHEVEQKFNTDIATPQSPQSTLEKHLMEETKEEQQNLLAKADDFSANIQEREQEHEYEQEMALHDAVQNIEQKMDDLILSNDDGIPKQIEEIAEIAANTITQNENPFLVHEFEQKLEEPMQMESTPTPTPTPTSASPLPPQEEQHVEDQHVEDQHVEEQHLQEQLVQEQHVEEEPQMPTTEQMHQEFEDENEQKLFNDFVEQQKQQLVFEQQFQQLNQQELLQEPYEQQPIQTEPEKIHDEIAQPIIEEAAIQLKHEVDVNAAAPAVEEPKTEATIAEPFALNESIEPSAQVESSEPVSTGIDATVAAAAAATTAAVTAAVVGAAALATKTGKKSETPAKKSIGKTTAAAAKPKVSDTKKPAADAKKPLAGAIHKTTATSTTAAARPRTAPAKSALGSADKKTTTTTTRSTTTTARKPLTLTSTTTTTTTRIAPRTSNIGVTKTSATTTTKTPAPRTSTSTTTSTVRRNVTGSYSGAPTTNGTAAKPRPTTAPAKPTTLGLHSATAKPKMLSPRATLTSQLRKTAPGAGATAGTKSPTKPLTNGVGSKTTTMSSTTAPRSKLSGIHSSTTTTTTTTKTFTARPAPRTTLSSTTTTTRRSTGAAPLGLTSTTASKTAASTMKRSPLSKPSTVGVSKLSATKTTTTTAAALKSKTKEVKSPLKTNATLKQKQAATSKSAPTATNGIHEVPVEVHLNGVELPAQQLQAELIENGNGHGQPDKHNDVLLAAASQAEQTALIDA